MELADLILYTHGLNLVCQISLHLLINFRDLDTTNMSLYAFNLLIRGSPFPGLNYN